MVTLSAVDSFWATFREVRKLLYRHILLLVFVFIPITYQVVCVQFIIEEWKNRDCNNGTCTIPASTTHNGSDPNSQIVVGPSQLTEEFKRLQTVLVVVHYCGMSLGVILLGILADRYGRLKVLFPTSVIMFLAAFSSAFLLKTFFLFFLLRFIAGFAVGGASLCIFALTAEYADPFVRAYVMSAIWLAAVIGCFSLPGLAYAIVNIESFLAVISLPLLASLLIWRIVPESPRWALLNSSLGPREESRVLLTRYVDDDRQNDLEFRSCWSLWGRFSSSTLTESREVKNNWHCWRCLRNKEMRNTFFTLSFSWFAIGLLFCALGTRSIQILGNFYSNHAVRSLISLPAIAIHCFLVNWAGRRFTTTLCTTSGGLICFILLISYNKHSHVPEAVSIVLQLLGRVFVETSMFTLCLYTFELFPTVIRCFAVGVVSAVALLAAAVSPLIMNLDIKNPIIPLGVLGMFYILAGILCRFMLEETKGKMTRENFGDRDNVLSRVDINGSPKIHRRARVTNEYEDSGRESPDGESQEELLTSSEGVCKDVDDSLEKTLGTSWEMSLDRTSYVSKWEWLSYEDTKRSYSNSVVDSLSVEQNFNEESKLLTEKDIKKLSKRLPSSTWILVYSTYLHGISLSTLYYRMRDFDTPVLVVIKDSKNYVFGVYAPVAIRVDPKFYGAGRSFFFSCKPKFKVYPCSGKNEYYMSGEVDSLAFGCSEGNFGLWLDKDLYRGRSTACETYDSDVLSASEDFICHGLEAWTFE